MSKDKKIIEGRVLSFDKNPFDKDGISEVDTEKIRTIQEEINELERKRVDTDEIQF